MRDRPDAHGAVLARLANPTANGGPLVLQLVDGEVDTGATWVEARLPIRPNGTTGWVRLDQLRLAANPYRVEIDTAAHHMRIVHENRTWLETTVSIGTGATPTPLGSFYITELLAPPDPAGPYGPFAFGLSGFSETLRDFAGGDGVIGIHGTNDPGSLGGDVSHGCVRVHNDVIRSLAGVLPLGTPVVIA